MRPDQNRFGVGLRRPHFDDILQAQPRVDFFEVISENFMTLGGRPRRVLGEVSQRCPILAHGVGLSIGGPDPLDRDYLRRLSELARRIEAPVVSDHLAYASAHGVQYHELLPLPFTEEAVQHVVARVDEVQEVLGRQFVLENPTYYATLGRPEMSEAEFIGEVVRRSGCALLLDVNNVWVNACNHRYDPHCFIDALPLDSVVQLHMAGHDATGRVIIDTHGAPVTEPVLELYRYTLERVGPVWTLLEWDHALPSLDRLVGELDRLRAAAASVGPRASTAEAA